MAERTLDSFERMPAPQGIWPAVAVASQVWYDTDTAQASGAAVVNGTATVAVCDATPSFTLTPAAARLTEGRACPFFTAPSSRPPA
jgi:hypothetical protein